MKLRVKVKQSNFKWVDKEKKNKINKLSEEYFDFIKRNSLVYFNQIEGFLEDPRNKQCRDLYDSTVEDLQETIIIERNEYAKFEKILYDLYQYVITVNKNLMHKRKLVHIFLHYMYCNCDIGKVE